MTLRRTTEKPRPQQATGASRTWRIAVGSVAADVDGAIPIAVRRHDRAGHVAAAVDVATDEADAEAVAPVVMMKAAATPSTTPPAAPRLGGSSSGSQRHGA